MRGMVRRSYRQFLILALLLGCASLLSLLLSASQQPALAEILFQSPPTALPNQNSPLPTPTATPSSPPPVAPTAPLPPSPTPLPTATPPPAPTATPVSTRPLATARPTDTPAAATETTPASQFPTPTPAAAPPAAISPTPAGWLPPTPTPMPTLEVLPYQLPLLAPTVEITITPTPLATASQAQPAEPRPVGKLDPVLLIDNLVIAFGYVWLCCGALIVLGLIAAGVWLLSRRQPGPPLPPPPPAGPPGRYSPPSPSPWTADSEAIPYVQPPPNRPRAVARHDRQPPAMRD